MRSLAVIFAIAAALGIAGALFLRLSRPPASGDCFARLEYIHRFGERYAGEFPQLEQACRR